MRQRARKLPQRLRTQVLVQPVRGEVEDAERPEPGERRRRQRGRVQRVVAEVEGSQEREAAELLAQDGEVGQEVPGQVQRLQAERQRRRRRRRRRRRGGGGRRSYDFDEAGAGDAEFAEPFVFREVREAEGGEVGPADDDAADEAAERRTLGGVKRARLGRVCKRVSSALGEVLASLIQQQQKSGD